MILPPFLVTALMALILMASSALTLAQTTPGTVLRNQAEMTYFDPLEGETVRVLSNVSSVVVAEQVNLALDTDKQRPGAPGERINFEHTLSNTGNLPDQYRLVLDNLGDDDGDLNGLSVHIDVNGNGLADPGEPAVDSLPRLLPGESLDLVITVSVPASANLDDVFRLNLEAISETSGDVADSVTDTVTIQDGASIVLNKTASQVCSAPLDEGQVLGYQIAFINNGNANPPARTLLVDGNAVEGVVIEDVIPPNTSLVPGNEPSYSPRQGVMVVREAGAARDEWVTYENWNGRSAQRIGLILPADQMRPNQSGDFAFDVTVNEGIADGTVLFNRATIDYQGDTRPNVESNQVCNQVNGSVRPGISFQRPSNQVLRDGATPDHGDDNDFIDTALYSLPAEDSDKVLEDGVYLRLTASQLNLSATDPEYFQQTPDGERLFTPTVRSQLTGDDVRVVVQETAPNSGVFRSVFPLVLSDTLKGDGRVCPANADRGTLARYSASTTSDDAIRNACVLNTQANDRLDVSYDVPSIAADGSVLNTTTVTDRAAVNPFGNVFDASTGERVSGAKVTLFQSRQPLAESAASSCSDLSESDFRRAVNPITDERLRADVTDTRGRISRVGRYQFPKAAPEYCYYLDVDPPEGYNFPSETSTEAARQYFSNVEEGSYGRGGFGNAGLAGAFLLSGASAFLDIPLDPTDAQLAGNLVVEKSADEDIGAVGDVISYSVDITNNSDDALFNVLIDDTPAYGFRYIADSAWLEVDGERIEIPEPQRDLGSQMTFRLARDDADSLQPFVLESGASVTLNYAMRLSAGAVDSDGINRALAQANTRSGFTYTSNQDEAEVEVRNEGVLSDRAIIFGKVYVDSDCSNQQSEGEWPIAGVKLYLQDGSWVITDENGQYSLFDRRPELHTIKVDTLTLPEGVTLKPIDNRHAADGESRFVDLRGGEMHRADFAAACPSPEEAGDLRDALQQRMDQIDGEWMLEDAARFDPLSRNPRSRRQNDADGSGDLGSGVYTVGGMLDNLDDYEERYRQRAASNAERVPQLDTVDEQMPATEEVAPEITRHQAEAGEFLWPRDNISNDGRLQVVIPGGLTPSLFVNGEDLGDQYLGEQILNRRERAAVISWYGVPLEEGTNRVEVKAKDAFGNERELAATEIIRPAGAFSLALKTAASTLPADGGRSSVPVQVIVKDANGNLARGTHFVTLENTRGIWREEDLQPDNPGFQVRVRNGEALVNLRSTEKTGPIDIKASLDDMSSSTEIEQIAPMRPLIATGLIQGRETFGHTSSNGERPTSLASDAPVEGTEKRAAAFIKGGIRGDMHLTLAYDSENQLDEEDEIRRDLNPADYYPIAGDASVRGYDARSASKLYAKLEKDRNSLMWGDYLTDSGGNYDDLGRVQRNLTGINAVLENDSTRLQLFGAESDYDQVSEEIDGNGTAMLFTLSNRPRRDSETLELVVRDRNNPGLTLSTRTLRRNVDYSINYFTGDIRFFDVIPSFDDDNNPVVVRANYELEDSSDETSTILGARLTHQFTDEIDVSVSYTDDDHEETGFDLSSLTARYKLDDRNTVYGSVATMSNREDDTEGDAMSVGVQRQWENGGSTDVRWAKAEEGFSNSAGGISEGREEARVAHRQPITSNLAANIEAIHSDDLESSDKETSVGLMGELDLGKTRLMAGARRIEQQEDDETDRFTTAILGAERNLRLGERPLSLGAEYEQALEGSDRKRIAADAELGITDNTSVYARYDFKNSLTGINQLSSDTQSERLSVGTRSSVTQTTDVFSEYRLEGAQDGRDTAVASGVRSDLEVTEGVTVSPSFEWINAVDGDDDQNSTAVSVAVEDLRDENRRTLARIETRFGNDRTYYGLSAANIWRLNQDWSGVVRNDLRLQDFDDKERDGDNIVTLGFARRPLMDNRHHTLFMYKWKEKWGGESGNDSTVHLLSNHHNYQAHDDLILSGRLGGKWQTTELDAFSESTEAYIADGRIIWDINRRFDLDLHGGVLATEGGDELRYSYGLGLNALVRRNLRLGIGYNVSGFTDEDLDPQGYNAEGLYIGFEFKFDENDLDWLGATAAEQRSYLGESK